MERQSRPGCSLANRPKSANAREMRIAYRAAVAVSVVQM